MDIFDPQFDSQWDDILITGMDSYFDDFKTEQIFKNCQRLLGDNNKGKRLIFVLRYNDNLVTKIIDELLLSMEAGLKNIKLKMSNGGKVYSRKFHGYRRSRKEILKIAEKCGYKLGRVFYAGFGVELGRSTILQKIPFFIKLAKKVDRYFRACNNATIFEFLYQPN